MKTLLVLLLLTVCNLSSAETFIQINGFSIHDKSGFNSVNYGAGIEQTINNNWSVAGGWYRNSEYRGSTYGYARYAIYKEGKWNIGIGVGAVTGYNKMSVMPMAFPEVCYSYVCSIAIPQVDPSGATALALRLQLPI